MATAHFLEIRDDGGILRSKELDAEAIERLDALLEAKELGRLPAEQYLAGLAELTERYPDFIDGYAYLGFALLKRGRVNAALVACRQGLSIGEAAIETGFLGRLHWQWHENRPFLRAAQGVALCLHALKRGEDTIAMMERILAWNPNDNQGIRFLLGSEYLRTGQTKKAARIMKAESDRHPPYLYELALIDVMAGRMVEAATRLRRAFIANGYVAEVLSGMPKPMPLAIWHGSNLAEPKIAVDYTERYGALWHGVPGALEFLRWLHTHPKVLGERAAVFGLKEQLLWEHDFESRAGLLERHDELVRAIGDELSREIVALRNGRDGRAIEPWLYPATVWRDF